MSVQVCCPSRYLYLCGTYETHIGDSMNSIGDMLILQIGDSSAAQKGGMLMSVSVFLVYVLKWKVKVIIQYLVFGIVWGMLILKKYGCLVF